MELVSDEKLEAVADFLSDDEVFGIAPCSHFNNSLKRNRVNVPCDIGDCDGDCPFYSKKNFIKWIKKPDSKYDVDGLKKPKKEAFLCYDNRSGRICLNDDYVKALENYCNDLEDVLADTEYDLESEQCENKALLNKLEKIRGVLDGKD